MVSIAATVPIKATGRSTSRVMRPLPRVWLDLWNVSKSFRGGDPPRHRASRNEASCRHTNHRHYEYLEVPIPEPRPGEVLIRAHACFERSKGPPSYLRNNSVQWALRPNGTTARASDIGTGGMTRDNLNCLSRKAIDSCRANQQSLTILNSQNDSSRSLRKSARMPTMRLWSARSRRSYPLRKIAPAVRVIFFGRK